jgi:hypothetical protein
MSRTTSSYWPAIRSFCGSGDSAARAVPRLGGSTKRHCTKSKSRSALIAREFPWSRGELISAPTFAQVDAVAKRFPRDGRRRLLVLCRFSPRSS